LAAEHVFYELPGSEVGAWDSFSTRNIGMKVNQRMAREFGGSSERVRESSSKWLKRFLGVNTNSWGQLECASFEDFAMVLSLAPGLASWGWPEKQALVQIIRSKSAAHEMRYLRLMQKHRRLRHVLLKLGS
jgi:hypothetical protein